MAIIVSSEWLLPIADKVNDLKQLPRTGWLLAGVVAPESVAEHCFATAWIALLLAEAINADWAGQGLTQPLSVERVLRIALVHDLAESVLTDLPKRSSDVLGRDVKHQAEAQALNQLLGNAPQRAATVAFWAEYDANTTPEARLVHDADKLEMVHQAFRYEQRGQRNLQEFWHDHHWHFPASAALFDQLFRQRIALATGGMESRQG